VTVDALERRRLFSGEILQTAIAPVLADTTTPTNNSITLNQHFFDPAEPGTIVEFNTSYGVIDVGLTDAATPNTVANFLNYVNSGAYDDSIFHRSSDLATGNNASPTDPGSIIQGGGYNVANGTVNAIPSNGNVNDEYTSELYGDVAGTIAMAKTSYANSANSEFYFNVVDNTFLDTPTTDPNGVTTSYTVFGKVLDSQSMNVISTIAALNTDANLGGDLAGSPVPLANLTAAQISSGSPAVTIDDLVFINTAKSYTGTTYNVSSDNKALVTPTVTNGVLSFTYGSGSGVANITVTATNLYDNTTATTTFAVTVPNPSTPTAGPVTNPFTAPDTVTGTTGTFSPLGADTDSVAALNPASVTIVTQPAHGTATVNVNNGFISYTPNAGYTGPDSLTYTVADTNGTVSAPGTVTLFAAPGAVTVTLGAGQTLTYVQPDGTRAHASVFNGQAAITFTDYQVTVTKVAGGYLASGAGADVQDIVITNNRDKSASMTVSSSGPISIGGFTDGGNMVAFSAPNATFTGAASFGSLQQLVLGGVTGTSVDVGNHTGYPISIAVPFVTNSDFNVQAPISSIRSTRWAVTDGQTHTLTAASIASLSISQKFDESLDIAPNASFSAPYYELTNVRVADPSGTWSITGSIFNASLIAPASTWSLSCGNYVRSLAITGDLTSNILAGNIGSLHVTGTTTNAVIQTNGTYNAKYLQIGRLSFGGQVSNSVVYSVGNVGLISAPSLVNSRVYAGVSLSIAQGGELAAASTDFTSKAIIQSINLTGRTTAFSNDLISAYDLIGMHLGVLATGNGGTLEGMSATKYGSITATLTPGGRMRAGPAQLKSATTLTAYETKAKLTLGDFQINFI
jgi:cyclophilin family peptidyl-prolyl cis-trans isomerase